MLNYINITKYLSYFSINFIIILNKKFLVITLRENNLKYYIEIPEFVFIVKLQNNLSLEVPVSFNNLDTKLLKKFKTYLLNFFNNFRIKSRKTLLIIGLGLKLLINNAFITFKLGYSNDINFIYDKQKFLIYSKKYGLKGNLINIYGYNKILLGNLAERIYKLKKADQYKLRGISNKDKMYILKTIKKK